VRVFTDQMMPSPRTQLTTHAERCADEMLKPLVKSTMKGLANWDAVPSMKRGGLQMRIMCAKQEALNM
jgi:hypothetical protein